MPLARARARARGGPRLLALCAVFAGCAVLSPSPALRTEPPDTRGFDLRGAVLGSDCSSARRIESTPAASPVHTTDGDLDRFGFVTPGRRIVVLECRAEILCSLSVTHLLPDAARAEALCDSLRRAFVSELGSPAFDTHGWDEQPPPEVEDFWDPGLVRTASWQLTLSQLMLDCPREPDGNGHWRVSATHATDPQLISHVLAPGVVSVEPAGACLPPR